MVRSPESLRRILTNYDLEDFMLCKAESRDPAHCLKEGRRVTRCATDLCVSYLYYPRSLFELAIQSCQDEGELRKLLQRSHRLPGE